MLAFSTVGCTGVRFSGYSSLKSTNSDLSSNAARKLSKTAGRRLPDLAEKV